MSDQVWPEACSAPDYAPSDPPHCFCDPPGIGVPCTSLRCRTLRAQQPGGDPYARQTAFALRYEQQCGVCRGYNCLDASCPGYRAWARTLPTPTSV